MLITLIYARGTFTYFRDLHVGGNYWELGGILKRTLKILSYQPHLLKFGQNWALEFTSQKSQILMPGGFLCNHPPLVVFAYPAAQL